ncbi:hypothetical protein [Clostridium perfringens]|uniref:hypothetical protein n=1 Tax=Clostridium perfringens TaxID=1502 RepID=UPI00016BD960|nr:hypothetical protein [Clostridium perfringens]EDT25438.1 conserved hypothetical protein [Clostridium perfringens CPE str. F4969]MDM0627486.1 hypothetical protein [Clostridium perfringens]MDU4052169.1 hypothetical protein [Clostridium perfringens]
MNKLLEKYVVEKKYDVIRDNINKPIGYIVKYYINSNNNAIKFIDNPIKLGKLFKRFNGIKADNFNKDFFESSNINIKEEDDRIIPVGLIECYSDKYIQDNFSIYFGSMRDIYNSKEIIENFERAIYLRCEALEFIDNFEVNIFK